jgi:hypothetical protein
VNPINTEPVLTVASIAAAIVAAAGLFHVVIDLNAVTAIVIVGVALAQAVIARSKVSPVAKA